MQTKLQLKSSKINKKINSTHTIPKGFDSMCTAVSYRTKDHYFGRTLDLEYSFDERVVITPRNFHFKFNHINEIKNHYAIIGMATVVDNYPLYYDAVNEKGLCIAGLRFPDYCIYHEFCDDKDNLASFELIPYILSNCENVNEAKESLENINITKDDFNGDFISTPLHWMISDKDQTITVESIDDGLKVYYNPVDVLTNSPPFPIQIFNLNNYMSMSVNEPETTFCDNLNLCNYSRGMGALGLPGDMSSQSRFVRGAFVRLNSIAEKGENESVSQFFHILDSVSQPRGVVKVKEKYVKTVYSSCCNANKGIYYYTTYENRRISSVNLNNENLDKTCLVVYNLETEQSIFNQN